ncbi:hypothetical protein L9F63_017961, partial [Diploptera punctata]
RAVTQVESPTSRAVKFHRTSLLPVEQFFHIRDSFTFEIEPPTSRAFFTFTVESRPVRAVSRTSLLP